jgi:hypothetical protein
MDQVINGLHSGLFEKTTNVHVAPNTKVAIVLILQRPDVFIVSGVS